MRVLFATTAGAGHFGPLEPFAAACRRAGHEVLVAGQASAAPMVGRAGLAFWALDEPAPDAVAHFRAGQEALAPTQAMGRAAGELYVRLYGAAALPRMVDAIEEWRPDVVVRESAEFSSLVAAERPGVPHAQVTFGLSTGRLERMGPLVAGPVDELRARVGLPTGRPPDASPTPEPPLGGWGDPGAPLVSLSFGTEVPALTRLYFPALYRKVIDALAELPVRLLVTTGLQRDPAGLGPVPPSVRVERWVPNAAVLRDAAAMIGHGGAGSVLGALAAGVPMGLIPLFADQPLNARRVAQIGAGFALEDGPALASNLRTTVPELLTDPRYRTRAREVAHEMSRLPPIDRAVEVLEALSASRCSA